jgi:hypothetical protein
MSVYAIYNKNNGKILSKKFDTLKEAIKEANKQNIITRNYNFLVTNINK